MAQQTLRDYLQETEDAISKGRVDDAFARCQYILTQFPEALEAQRLLGEVYLAQGNLDEAQQTFDWVLTNDPENVIAYCDRALISERQSDYDTALDCYQQAYELSRGNSQIRNEFNKLSTKAGQPGFMFSRAGLARLYMRGDLLTQAIQEWEAVLATSPDRLDARTGLLEAYWREGLYDRVEQLAAQILQDVPGCVKALLLLAYATCAKDSQQAQDLLRRVELLDPDLVLAQDLFADMIAGQPNDPFLQLLKKSPTSLQAAGEEPALPAVVSSVSQRGEALAPSDDALSAAFNGLPSWAGIDASWNNESMTIKPPIDAQPTQASPLLPTWSGEDTAQADGWNAFSTQQETPSVANASAMPEFAAYLNGDTTQAASWDVSDQTTQAPRQEEPQLEPWMAWQEAQDNTDLPSQPLDQAQPTLDHQQEDKLAEPLFDSIEAWGGTKEGELADFAASWTSSAKNADLPAPPDWLNMLTQNERRQMSESLPAQPSSTAQKSPVSQPTTQKPADQVSQPAPAQKEESLPVPAPPELDQDEDSFFGPEWLKSLGAATMDTAFSDESNPALPAVDPPQPQQPAATSEPWTVPAPDPVQPAQPPDATWRQPSQPLRSELPADADWNLPTQMPYAAQTPEPVWTGQFPEAAREKEQNIVFTLEELEQDLRSQGFVPLEPNSLSTIAQAQDAASQPNQAPAQPQESYPEPTLSSAFAELGNFAQQQAASPADQPPSEEAAEPSWLVSLAPTPLQNAAPAPHISEEASAQPGAVVEPVASTTPAPQPPAIVPPSPAKIESPKASAPRVDPFLDSALEMTMRRPAVRLQPMQQRPAAHHSISFRDQSYERSASKAANLSPRDRLLKGYQHQLVGEYDEAMQEYRVIIRSAPELLGEVVSNVRALLKLAPKYSTGYRVLGDAYMRQGEYLQAMEAYNKALTMAKKAKA